ASAASDYMDSTSQLNRYALAADDSATRVVLQAALAVELNSESNVYGQDLEILLARRQVDEVDVTLRSSHVGGYNVLTGEEIPMFAFSSAGMQVQLGLGSSLGVSPNAEVVRKLQALNRTDAGSIAQIVSVYWFNGSAYLRISDPTLTSSQALSVSVKNV